MVLFAVASFSSACSSSCVSCVCAGVCLKVSCLDSQYRRERREWRGDKEGRNEDEEMLRREKREGGEKDRG